MKTVIPTLILALGLLLPRASSAQAPPPAPPAAAVGTPDLHLAGTELVKSAQSTTISLVVGILGGLCTGAIAAQLEADDDHAPVYAMAGITMIGSLSFAIVANGHKKKAGRALLGIH